MPRQPLSRERICDALESCRPGSGDLYSPDFADVAEHVAANSRWDDLYEQIQSIDLKISAAYHDVEIPPGLESRLLASIEFARVEDAIFGAATGDAEIAPPPESFAVPAAKKNRAVSRRRLVLAGSILTVAAALFLAVFLWMDNAGGYSDRTVLEESIRFFDADIPAAPGLLLARSPAPGRYPLSKAIRSFAGIRWRTVNNFLGRSGVAFDLPAQGGTRATLYAVDRAIAGLDALPTSNPANTGGCYVAAWQEDGLVYVLVVRGDRGNYRQYLRPSDPLV
ncbi:MAG: hypothetical protein IT426_10470 [Pirellulales bacterium]|nr:hypothetical protein [Pirellulales bacterium]